MGEERLKYSADISPSEYIDQIRTIDDDCLAMKAVWAWAAGIGICSNG